MTDSFKLRFIEWHKDIKVLLINCVITLVVLILFSLMDSVSIGKAMLLFLHSVVITFFIISNAISKYNTLTILANNFWYILFSSSGFVFWVSDILLAIPAFFLVGYLTKNVVGSFSAFTVLTFILIFMSKKVSKYFKSKITAWVF